MNKSQKTMIRKQKTDDGRLTTEDRKQKKLV